MSRAEEFLELMDEADAAAKSVLKMLNAMKSDAQKALSALEKSSGFARDQRTNEVGASHALAVDALKKHIGIMDKVVKKSEKRFKEQGLL